jgi:predicted component of type VI protein secretion system
MSNLEVTVTPSDPLARHGASPRELKALLMAERDGVPFLAYRDEHGGLQIAPLPAAASQLLLGRGESVDVRLHWDPQISGVHAELRRLGSEWTIVDDNLSRNGTHVNARRVSGRCRLRDGDRITLGTTTIAFRAPSAPRIAPTTTGEQLQLADALSDTQRRILLALCRPKLTHGEMHAPATNQEIASEICLSVDTVKAQLRGMFTRYHLDELPQNQKRARLAEIALQSGLVSSRQL